MISERTFPCQPDSVPAARRFVRELLRGRAPEAVEAAELMACELVTNCIEHARTEFTVNVLLSEQIRVEVSDTGAGVPEVRTPAHGGPERGRGLQIVASMSDGWGVTRSSAAGKTVWFTLPGPDAPPAPARRGARALDFRVGGEPRRAHGRS